MRLPMNNSTPNDFQTNYRDKKIHKQACPLEMNVFSSKRTIFSRIYDFFCQFLQSGKEKFENYSATLFDLKNTKYFVFGFLILSLIFVGINFVFLFFQMKKFTPDAVQFNRISFNYESPTSATCELEFKLFGNSDSSISLINPEFKFYDDQEQIFLYAKSSQENVFDFNKSFSVLSFKLFFSDKYTFKEIITILQKSENLIEMFGKVKLLSSFMKPTFSIYYSFNKALNENKIKDKNGKKISFEFYKDIFKGNKTYLNNMYKGSEMNFEKFFNFDYLVYPKFNEGDDKFEIVLVGVFKNLPIFNFYFKNFYIFSILRKNQNKESDNKKEEEIFKMHLINLHLKKGTIEKLEMTKESSDSIIEIFQGFIDSKYKMDDLEVFLYDFKDISDDKLIELKNINLLKMQENHFENKNDEGSSLLIYNFSIESASVDKIELTITFNENEFFGNLKGENTFSLEENLIEGILYDLQGYQIGKTRLLYKYFKTKYFFSVKIENINWRIALPLLKNNLPFYIFLPEMKNLRLIFNPENSKVNFLTKDTILRDFIKKEDKNANSLFKKLNIEIETNKNTILLDLKVEISLEKESIFRKAFFLSNSNKIRIPFYNKFYKGIIEVEKQKFIRSKNLKEKSCEFFLKIIIEVDSKNFNKSKSIRINDLLKISLNTSEDIFLIDLTKITPGIASFIKTIEKSNILKINEKGDFVTFLLKSLEEINPGMTVNFKFKNSIDLKIIEKSEVENFIDLDLPQSFSVELSPNGVQFHGTEVQVHKNQIEKVFNILRRPVFYSKNCFLLGELLNKIMHKNTTENVVYASKDNTNKFKDEEEFFKEDIKSLNQEFEEMLSKETTKMLDAKYNKDKVYKADIDFKDRILGLDFNSEPIKGIDEKIHKQLHEYPIFKLLPYNLFDEEKIKSFNHAHEKHVKYPELLINFDMEVYCLVENKERKERFILFRLFNHDTINLNNFFEDSIKIKLHFFGLLNLCSRLSIRDVFDYKIYLTTNKKNDSNGLKVLLYPLKQTKREKNEIKATENTKTKAAPPGFIKIDIRKSFIGEVALKSIYEFCKIDNKKNYIEGKIANENSGLELIIQINNLENMLNKSEEFFTFHFKINSSKEVYHLINNAFDFLENMEVFKKKSDRRLDILREEYLEAKKEIFWKACNPYWAYIVSYEGFKKVMTKSVLKSILLCIDYYSTNNFIKAAEEMLIKGRVFFNLKPCSFGLIFDIKNDYFFKITPPKTFYRLRFCNISVCINFIEKDEEVENVMITLNLYEEKYLESFPNNLDEDMEKFLRILVDQASELALYSGLIMKFKGESRNLWACSLRTVVALSGLS